MKPYYSGWRYVLVVAALQVVLSLLVIGALWVVRP